MKKAIIVFLIFVASASQSFSQQYSTGLGVRLGGIGQGLSVKHFINSTGAIEGIVSFGRGSFLITGLYEKHMPIANAEGLTWFYGGGAHIGFYNHDFGYAYYHYYNHKGYVYVVNDESNANVSFGGDFILGLEYKFQKAPFTIGLDIKPFVDIIPGVYGYWDGALTARYTF